MSVGELHSIDYWRIDLLAGSDINESPGHGHHACPRSLSVVGFVLGPGYASSFALSRRDVSSGSYTAGLRRQRIGNGRVGRFLNTDCMCDELIVGLRAVRIADAWPSDR